MKFIIEVDAPWIDGDEGFSNGQVAPIVKWIAHAMSYGELNGGQFAKSVADRSEPEDVGTWKFEVEDD